MTHLNLNLGSSIQCRDGQCGKLIRVVVDPETGYVSDIIVAKGILLKETRILPLSVVDYTDENNLYLSIASSKLEQYPKYSVTEFKEPVAPAERVAVPNNLYGAGEPVVPMVKRKIRRGIKTGQTVIKKGMPVNNFNGTVGKVGQVIMDYDTNKITYLVMYQGLIFTKQLVIPYTVVESIYEDSIFISCTEEALEQLPRYVPENENHRE